MILYCVRSLKSTVHFGGQICPKATPSFSLKAGGVWSEVSRVYLETYI